MIGGLQHGNIFNVKFGNNGGPSMKGGNATGNLMTPIPLSALTPPP